jgi:hypothetical protein
MKTSIETMWKASPLTVELRDRTVTDFDLASVSLSTTVISLFGCMSNEWIEIGQRLAALSQLKTVSIQHCNSEDSLCAGIRDSKSLLSLRMGN